jgi:hypothetical protein
MYAILIAGLLIVGNLEDCTVNPVETAIVTGLSRT